MFAARARLFNDDRVLRIYAAILSGIHILTGAAWFAFKHVTTLTTGDDAVCWPFAPGCEQVRALLSPRMVGALVVTYMALGAAAIFAFLDRRAARGFFFYALASILGLGIYALDYRLRLNQTMMFAWASAIFFFAPRPKLAIQILVPLFYAWAGTLKLTPEWLSGDALYARPLFVPDALIPAACTYVVLLELVIIWGLYAQNLRIRIAVYAQLLLFHLTSFSVVSWFYPLMMIAITAIFPLIWRFSPDAAFTFSYLRRDAGLKRIALGIVGGFSICQIVPHLFPGDTAISGEGRLFALHMFDARVVCEGGATITRSSGAQSRARLINEHLERRIRCDPIVLGATTERLCRHLRENDPNDVPRVDVAIDARRTSETQMHPLMHVADACHADLGYSIWRHNGWIGM
jgi:hypothetical protein